MGGQIDIEGLLKKMTLEEKISLLAGRNFWETVAINRLEIPSLRMSDGPNGARGLSFRGGATAACFPASVLLAATWNTDLAVEVGGALAEEAKTKGASVLLGPTVCPHRSPLGGRNFESFSEDPFLAGKLAAKYITGLQDNGIGATIKHFAANEQETRRFEINVNVSERALREIYLKPFEIAIKEANPWAVMTSYSLVNGHHADQNEFLLKKVLRDQWGWKGLVMSDWGGTNSTTESINAGLDIEMPGPTKHRQISTVCDLVKSGKIEESTITERARNVLNLLSITGKFANPETPDEESIDKPEHRALIRKVGGEGIVLLKNEGGILPLDKQQLKGKKVAMLGLAKEALIHGGGSASVNAHYRITPWEGLKTALGEDVELEFAEGAHVLRTLPNMKTDLVDDTGKPGFTLAKYFTKDLTTAPTSTQNISDGLFAPIMEESPPKAVVATGTYTPKTSGKHYLSFSSLGPSKVYINSQLIHTQTTNCMNPMAFLLGGVAETPIRYTFSANTTYTIRIESFSPTLSDHSTGGGLSLLKNLPGFHLGFMTTQDHDRDLLAPAVALAKDAEVALVFVGNTTVWETEGQDQLTMNLPAYGSQDALISAVAAVNPNTIVINSTGVPIAMPWLSSIPALVQTWFPGQEAGNAIADILLGETNPSGRLPVTFPRSIEDTPAYGNFPGDIENLQVHYDEGVFIGYRHYDNLVYRDPEAVVFPFGYGLSYTTFSISNLSISLHLDNLNPLSSSEPRKTNNPTAATNPPLLIAEVSTTNTGTRAGKHVIQVYISSPSSPPSPKSKSRTPPLPIKTLAGFSKVSLTPGETQTVEIGVSRDALAYFCEETMEWVVGAGEYAVLVGGEGGKVEGREGFVVGEEVRWGV